MSRDLTREDRALLGAAHPMSCPERGKQLAELFAPPLNWPHLIAEADRHEVTGLLYHHLRTLNLGQVPPAALEAMAFRARACVAWNLRLRHELGRLLAGFERASIPVMPLKGPVLADQLYPDPLLRPAADLDLLVQGADCAAGERVLQELGYRRLPAHEQGADYHDLFMSENADARSVVVELHRDLGERHVAGLDVRAIWARAARTAWQGHATWSMAISDLLLYLCLHAVKDGLASIKLLVDIGLLVERFRDEIPWNDLVPRVKSAGLSGPIYLSLREACGLLGTPVPDWFLEALRPRRPSWRLSEAVLRWRGGVLHVPETLLVGPVMAILTLLWEDSLRGKLRHLRRNLVPSARLRARWITLPACSSWIVWYPVWLWQGARHVVCQVTARSSASPATPRPM